MLESNGDFEGGVAFGADLVLGLTIGIDHMTKTVEHDFVSPSEFAITLIARKFAVAGCSIPVHTPDESVAQMELVVDFPLLHAFGSKVVVIHSVLLALLTFPSIFFFNSFSAGFLLLLLESGHGLDLAFLGNNLLMVIQNVLVDSNDACKDLATMRALVTLYG